MPEGDTIWRTARALQGALAGRTCTALRSPVPTIAAAASRLRIVGRRVDGVEARGKHLLVRFEGGAVLHTHQGMRGAWRLLRVGEVARWHAGTRLVLEAQGVVAVCRLAPVVELLTAAAARAHPALARLGPDLLSEDFEVPAARARLRAHAGSEIGVALLDQTALAGIGNVYKSEVLFVCGVFPFARVRDLDDSTLDRLVTSARDLMSRNLGAGPRRTTPPFSPTPTFVYGRAGRACRRCGGTIERRTQGVPPRSTYWCTACQPTVGHGNG